jgi:hypothetical protein
MISGWIIVLMNADRTPEAGDAILGVAIAEIVPRT